MLVGHGDITHTQINKYNKVLQQLMGREVLVIDSGQQRTTLFKTKYPVMYNSVYNYDRCSKKEENTLVPINLQGLDLKE